MPSDQIPMGRLCARPFESLREMDDGNHGDFLGCHHVDDAISGFVDFAQVGALRIFVDAMPFEGLPVETADTNGESRHHAIGIKFRITSDIVAYGPEVVSRLFGPRNFHAPAPNSLQIASCVRVLPALMSARPASIFCLT